MEESCRGNETRKWKERELSEGKVEWVEWKTAEMDKKKIEQREEGEWKENSEGEVVKKGG